MRTKLWFEFIVNIFNPIFNDNKSWVLVFLNFLFVFLAICSISLNLNFLSFKLSIHILRLTSLLEATKIYLAKSNSFFKFLIGF